MGCLPSATSAPGWKLMELGSSAPARSTPAGFETRRVFTHFFVKGKPQQKMEELQCITHFLGENPKLRILR